MEAANLISAHRKHWADRHVVQLDQRVKENTKMHGKATMVVARHLAEESYWMLRKQEVYREPQNKWQALSSTHG